MRDILLLKSVDSENADIEDDYVKELELCGYHVHLMSPLEFEFVNQSLLRRELERACGFDGLVLTSKRSVKAVQHIFDELENIRTLWEEKLVFIVGERSAQYAKEVLRANKIIGGRDAVSGEKLAEIIQKQVKPGSSLLYPCSNIRRDKLPNIITSVGIYVKEVETYRTSSNPKLSTLLNEYFKDNIGRDVTSHVIYFSPSCVRFSLPIISPLMQRYEQEVRHYALGETTRKELEHNQINVSGVSQQPTPLGLINCLRST